jgi:hypothetical protein
MKNSAYLENLEKFQRFPKYFWAIIMRQGLFIDKNTRGQKSLILSFNWGRHFLYCIFTKAISCVSQKIFAHAFVLPFLMGHFPKKSMIVTIQKRYANFRV